MGKTKVGMVQINNSFDRQNYLPLSLGYLYTHASAHAKNFDDFEFLMPIHRRIAVDEAVEQLSDAEIVAFSTYVWNFELSSAIARRLKEQDPERVILFGGCHIPDTREKGLETFLRQNSFVDVAVTGEGERPFTAVLENLSGREWSKVPSAAYLDKKGEFVQTPAAPKIEDLNTIPSPYLTGFFDPLMKANPDEGWIGLFETNRGCPFHCSFCDWGIGAKTRMGEFHLEDRLFPEIDWFSKKGIEFVYCCDANFGIYASEKFGRRDLRIAERFAENKDKYGYPHRFSVQNTKNSTEASYNVQRILVDSKLDQGVLLAFQSLHEPTLDAVRRNNIKLDTFHELQRRFTSEGVMTFSDLILGLPEETYESWTRGVSTLMEQGQHNGIQMNNLSILPNAPMVEDVEKYGLKTVEAPIVNIHGSRGEWVDDIYEKQRLVVATDSMPEEDWVKSRNFGYMTSFLHFGKLLQVPNVILHNQYGVSYKELVDAFVDQDSPERPTLVGISSLFSDHAREIQGGGAEYVQSEEWLNMWWPPNEYALIRTASEGKLDAFYEEAEQVLDGLLRSKGSRDHGPVLRDALSFNRQLIKQPFQTEDLEVSTDHNILEVYRAGLVKEKLALEEGQREYTIDRASKSWNSWDDWAREVVWWGHKKGDYMYSATPSKDRETQDQYVELKSS